MDNIYTEKEMQKVIIPLAKLVTKQYKKNKTKVIGIQGGQGTGKSTLGAFLVEYLRGIGYSAERFSIDDFYETNKRRLQISKKYPNNAFYQIPRGMPGTHRTAVLRSTLSKIKAGKNFDIPIFDKSLFEGRGDVLKKTKKIKERQDFIIFEGWCIGAPYVSSEVFQKICKKHKIILRNLDPLMKDHKVVLQFLKKYQSLWKYIDYMIMLKPDSSDLHTIWRYQQEVELIEQKGQGMSKGQIENFVQPYLPITYLCYEKLKPKVTVMVNEFHTFYGLK